MPRKATRKTAKRAKKTAARGGRAAAKAAKEVAPEHELPGGFWRQVIAVLMIALAVFLVMTWFGSGGKVLNDVDAASFFLIGYAKFLLPVLLVYLAVKILRTPGNKLPIVVWIASFLMICWAAGVMGIPTIGQPNPTGGVLGTGLNTVAIQILNPGVAVFIYLVLIFITALFILQISPVMLFKKIASLFKSDKKDEDANNAKMMKAASPTHNRRSAHPRPR